MAKAEEMLEAEVPRTKVVFHVYNAWGEHQAGPYAWKQRAEAESVAAQLTEASGTLCTAFPYKVPFDMELPPAEVCPQTPVSPEPPAPLPESTPYRHEPLPETPAPTEPESSGPRYLVVPTPHKFARLAEALHCAESTPNALLILDTTAGKVYQLTEARQLVAEQQYAQKVKQEELPPNLYVRRSNRPSLPEVVQEPEVA